MVEVIKNDDKRAGVGSIVWLHVSQRSDVTHFMPTSILFQPLAEELHLTFVLPFIPLNSNGISNIYTFERPPTKL
jgi:hypothetical protein